MALRTTRLEPSAGGDQIGSRAGVCSRGLLPCDGGGLPAAAIEAATTLSGDPSSFDRDRAFADLRAQVAIGPRADRLGAATREAVALITSRLTQAGLRDVVRAEPAAQRRRDVPGH